MGAASPSLTGWGSYRKDLELNELFVQHQIGLLVFLVILLLIAVSNLRYLRRMGDYPAQQGFPRVSILAPARNEEQNIGPCVESLLAQRYPNYEVIVLNDDSSDRTGEILAQFAVAGDRLRVVNGTPLPPGWLGKNWACHQLAQVADGELLLFVDADTRHSESMLEHAVAALEAEQADLLSAIPREEVVTWAERLVVPIIPWSVFSFLPVFVANRVQWPWLSAAIGQFMLFRRTAYEQVGGHAAVRTSVVDDLSLARHIKAAGLRWRLVDGTANMSCRMYRNSGEVVHGVSRTLFAVFENRIAIHLFVWLWLAVAFVEPPVVLLVRLASFPVSRISLWLAVAAVLTSLGIWIIAYSRLGIPRYLALAYPLSILIAAAIAVRSAFVTLTGRVTWRGRHLPATP